MSMDKEIQAMMQKIEVLKMQSHQNHQPQKNMSNVSFDNQDLNYAQSEGNGLFDNQGPDPQKYYDTVLKNNNPNFQPQQQYHQPLGFARGSDVCPQCKTIHPPIQLGEKCPNAGVGNELKDKNLTDEVINKNLVDMRNIIISNISNKNIKDGKKFFQYAVIELTKALERYNENN